MPHQGVLSLAKGTEAKWRDPENKWRADADSGYSLQALSPKPHFPAPVLSQVLPTRIELLNQGNFLFPPPAFDLLLTRDGHLNVLMAFVIDQAMALVFLGETFDGVVLVLVNTALEESGDANVKRSRSAGKNVNPEFVVEAVSHRRRG